MKIPIALLFSMLTAGLACNASDQATPGQDDGPAGGDNGEMLSLIFGEKLAFSATAHSITRGGPKAPPPQEFTEQYAVRDGKVRIELDVTKTPAGAGAANAQFGLADMIYVYDTIHSPLVMFPKVKACTGGDAFPPGTKIIGPRAERTVLGSETVDGHPCVKVKTTIINGLGATIGVATTWEAKDLNQMPVRVVIPALISDSATTTLTFTKIQAAKPDAALFKAPAGYRHYDSADKLLDHFVPKDIAPQPNDTGPGPF